MLTNMYILLQLLHDLGVLLENCPGFVGLLHQVLTIGDKHNWVHDMRVIEKHADDFTGGITINVLNDVVDSVTNFLTSLSWLHLQKACNKHFLVKELAGLLN